MKQLPNGDFNFYGSLNKSMLFCIIIISGPVLCFLAFAAVVWHTVDIFLVLVTIALLVFIFGVSYLLVRKMDIPPSIVVHNDSLEYRNKYGGHFLPLQQFAGFTTTPKRFLSLQALIFITHNFHKKYTPCLLCLFSEDEKRALFDVLQAKGLTYFPPESKFTKK